MSLKAKQERVSATELVKQGYQNNPNCWIGSGYIFCGLCMMYVFHYVLSKGHDHKVVCNKCHSATYITYVSDNAERSEV